MTESDPIDVPEDLVEALANLRALLRISERLRVSNPPRTGEARLADLALARAEEGVRALARLFPEQPGVHPVPRIPLALVGRWLAEGCALWTWISHDPVERTKQWYARGASERRELLRGREDDVPVETLDGLEDDAKMASHAKRPSKYVDEIAPGVGLRAVYADFCEVSHWNAAWLASTYDDDENGAWGAHLIIIPAFFRGMIEAVATILGVDPTQELDAIFRKPAQYPMTGSPPRR